MMLNRYLSLTLAALLLTLSLTGCGEKKETPVEPPVEENVVEPLPEPEPEPEPIVSTIAVCGDVMTHMNVIRDAYNPETDTYDFTRMLAGTAPRVQAADYAIVNLETTLSEGNYSGYPCFKAPDSVVDSLQATGFDLVLTANNHCMDAGFKGLTRTLDVLDAKGMAHVGTSRTQEEADSDIVLADVGGISVAILGYTYGTNGIPLSKDAPWSVNLFNTDYTTSLSTPDTDRLERDFAKAKALDADLIAVLVHWGVEYQTKQNAYQEKIADLLIGYGADMVLGGHSHVLQPAEMRTVTDAEGQERTGFVSYSLGNYISNQNDIYTDVTAVLQVELTKDEDGAYLSDWSYAPIWRSRLPSGTNRFDLMDVHEELAAGNGPVDKLNYALEACHTILGPEHDVGAALAADSALEPAA